MFLSDVVFCAADVCLITLGVMRAGSHAILHKGRLEK